MKENMRLIRLCFLSLRFAFLSCWGLEESEGKWVAKRSNAFLALNLSVVGVLGYFFKRVIAHQNQPTIYKYSSLVFPLYTQFLIVIGVAFLICGNGSNRKFASILNHFPPVLDRLRKTFGRPPLPIKSRIKVILSMGLLWLVASIAVKLYLEFHLILSYPKSFRIVYYYTSYYAAFFTVQFVVTMDHVKGNYFQINFAFEKILSEETRRIFITERKRPDSICHQRRIRRKLGPRGGPSDTSDFENSGSKRKLKIWMTFLMEFREIEDLVNQVFGKQIFLLLLLGFSGIIINLYFFATLNLYKSSNVWLNSCFVIGLMEAVALLLTTIGVAEDTSQEANKINDKIFYFPLSQNNWCSYGQVKYLTMFFYRYPTQFRAWVFYTVSYSSLFKVIAASSAITIIFLQCEFMRSITVN